MVLDLTDRTPIKYSMTFPLRYNTTALKSENVKYYRVKDDLYELGIITAKSPSGNSIRIYNAERTLCDLYCNFTIFSHPNSEYLDYKTIE
jgi:hypothetical protein